MSREEIMRQIVLLDLQKKDMSPDSVQQQDLQLYENGCQLFRVWKTALKQPDINLRRVRAHHDNLREAVLRQIRLLSRKGYDLQVRVNNTPRTRIITKPFRNVAERSLS